MTSIAVLLFVIGAVLLAADLAVIAWCFVIPWLRERQEKRQRAEQEHARAELERELRSRLRVGGMQARRRLIEAAARASAAREHDHRAGPGR